jgi:CTP-dependent riboflavin kinase
VRHAGWGSLVNVVVLRGHIASGKGDLAQWMRLHARRYAAATGLALYPGSLNLILDKPYELPSERIRLSADEVGVDINLVECSAFGRRAFIFRTDADDAKGPSQRSLIEILSDVHLRDAYGLHDGDLVEIVI